MSKNIPKVLMTANGLDKIKKEYGVLVIQKLPKTIDRVAKARDQGDLSENSEYSAARDELDLIETRIAELKNVLNQAQIVPNNEHNGKVALGSTVVIELEGELKEYTVVGSLESDPVNGKISDESPVGKTLMGARVGEMLVIPGTESKLTIKEIKS